MTPHDQRDDRGSIVGRRDLLRKGAIGAGSAALGVAALSGTALAGCTVDHECARTPGFWRNHPDMWHGGDHLHLGTAGDTTDRFNYFSSFDGRPSVLEILEMPARGDKSVIMATHLIATLLNLTAGTDPSCIEETVRAAKAWLDTRPVGSDVRGWDGGEGIKDELDAYNNGERCACPAD